MAGVWEDGWVAGVWEDDRVTGVWEDGWVAGVWEDGWVTGVWEDDRVTGVWEDGWVAGVWEDGWVAGVWEDDRVTGVWEDGCAMGVMQAGKDANATSEICTVAVAFFCAAVFFLGLGGAAGSGSTRTAFQIRDFILIVICSLILRWPFLLLFLLSFETDSKYSLPSY